MIPRTIAAAMLLALLVPLPGAALTISVQYDYGGDVFDGTSESGARRRAVVDAAASYVSGLVGSHLAAIEPGEDDAWLGWIKRPDEVGGTIEYRQAVPEDMLLLYVGTRRQKAGVFATTERATVPYWQGSEAFGEAVLNRGLGLGPNRNHNRGVWAASISYNHDLVGQWFVGLDAARPFSGFDLWTFTVHELIHALGFGVAREWRELVASGDFHRAGAVAADLGQTLELTADGLHWAGSMAGRLPGQGDTRQPALLGPYLPEGERRWLTDLDLAGLEDMGWQVTAVPLPAALPLLTGALAIFALATRRRRPWSPVVADPAFPPRTA